jgi:hypothetical protein
MPRMLIDGNRTAFFTVDRAVGRNAPNDRLDVLLVQFLLFLATKVEIGATLTTVPRGLRVATRVAAAEFATPTRPRPQGSIVIDGICGGQTISFIEYFQETMQLKYKTTELNGQVTVLFAPGTSTMEQLNTWALWTLARPWQLFLSDAFPQELSSSFYVPNVR